MRREDVDAWIAGGAAAGSAIRRAGAAVRPAAAPAARPRRVLGDALRALAREEAAVSMHRIERPDGSVGWRVRWRDGGRGSRARTRTFDRKGDAQRSRTSCAVAGASAISGCWSARRRRSTST